jgi:hypothetical protein
LPEFHTDGIAISRPVLESYCTGTLPEPDALDKQTVAQKLLGSHLLPESHLFLGESLPILYLVYIVLSTLPCNPCPG